jgi:hypothetical protein
MRHAARVERRWRLAAVLLGAVVLSIGCNPLTLSYFLFEPDSLVQPKCPIACAGKEVKLVIISEHAVLPDNPMLQQADSELSYRLTHLLEERYRENKEKVKIVSPTQLRQYQNTNPKWREQTAQEIGKHFHADYVLNLEINELRLYDKRSAKFFYHGYADLTLTVTDVQKPLGEGEKYSCPYSLEYPRAPMEISEMPVNQFRAKLLDRVAKDLVQFFAAHPPRDKYDSD